MFRPIRRRVRQSRLALGPFDVADVAGLAIVGAYVFVGSLGAHPLRRWDESIYANVARLMAEQGYWLVPHLYVHPQKPQVHLQPFLEKPPLVFWLQGLSMEVFGVSRFAVRLPVALFAILSGLLVYRFGTRLYDRAAGLTAAGVLFTTPMVFARGHGGRTGNLDVPLLFFGTAFVALAWLALVHDRRDLFLAVGVAAGLAFMTKGFNAGIFVVAIAPVALYYGRRLRRREVAVMVAVTAAIAVPWPLYAWMRYGHEFVSGFFLSQVVARATGEAFISNPGMLPFMRFPYFRTLPETLGVWVVLVVPAAVIALYRGWRTDDLRTPLWLVWWAGSTLAFFAVTGNHPWYLMPMAVPCGLLVGAAVTEVAAFRWPAVVGAVVGELALVTLGGLSLPTTVLVGALVAVFLVGPADSALETVLSGGWLRFCRAALPVVLVLVVVGALVGGVPLTPQVASGEERLGRLVDERAPEDEVVALGAKTEHLFVFSFYAQRPLTGATAAELNHNERIRYAVVTGETARDVTRPFSVMARWRGQYAIRL